MAIFTISVFCKLPVSCYPAVLQEWAVEGAVIILIFTIALVAHDLVSSALCEEWVIGTRLISAFASSAKVVRFSAGG